MQLQHYTFTADVYRLIPVPFRHEMTSLHKRLAIFAQAATDSFCDNLTTLHI